MEMLHATVGRKRTCICKRRILLRVTVNTERNSFVWSSRQAYLYVRTLDWLFTCRTRTITVDRAKGIGTTTILKIHWLPYLFATGKLKASKWSHTQIK